MSIKSVADLSYGLLFTALLAAVAYLLRFLPGMATFSPMILAVVIGMLVRNTIGVPKLAGPGIAFSMKAILRIAIVILGFQLTISEVVQIGPAAASIVVMAVAFTLIFTIWLGRLLAVPPTLATLIGVGTAICGASAVVAASVANNADDEEVSYALASVTIFGTLALFIYPLLQTFLGLEPHYYGMWAGASIHEVGQVVAAAFQQGPEAGEVATLVKLSRIFLLAPVVLLVGYFAAKGGTDAERGQAVRMPWFITGFAIVVAINSWVTPLPGVKAQLMSVTAFLLSMALAGLGLHTDARKLRLKGFRPVILGASASILIGGFSFLAISALVFFTR